MEPDRLSRELTSKLEAARMTAEALSLEAHLARDTVGRWIRGTTLPTLAALRQVEGVLSGRLGYPADLSAAVRERRAARAPGPAQRGEVVAYLRTLIDWLNHDPWPRDQRLAGPVLAPAAIERKLWVASEDTTGRQVLDADELADQCRRLVILGGPGSGKTWLAMRVARRCAEGALAALAAGQALDEVELPLFTTCSHIFGAVGDIRRAVISAALDHVADLGDSRLSDALRQFFAERSAPALLVIDSLDEASGPQERLRQADTLPWRIILTSRASSWNNQLLIEGDTSCRLGELQPLHYPQDVEPFIQRWFIQRPEWGRDVAAQIARRPDLHRAATVPLILAFYCIVGVSDPLPEFRHDLYAKVLKRMLTGRWRGADDRQPDVNRCLQMLRAWAWSGAESHPVSGIGKWLDDIPTGGVLGSDDDKAALDHVATPLGPPDADTGYVLRRFIHRSIREHLVAEYIASLPLSQAAEILLSHFLYDPDWEYSAPAALAMHRENDQLLRDLICRATGSEHLPENLSDIGFGREFRRFLARVAAESSETDWSPQIAGIIGQARVELARSGHHVGDLAGGTRWGTSNIRVRETLVGMLPGQTSSDVAQSLVSTAVQLATTAEDKHQLRAVLLGLLPAQSASWPIEVLVRGLIQLAITAEDKHPLRAALLALLGDQTSAVEAAALADGVAQLDPTAEDQRQAREELIRLRETAATAVAHSLVQFNPTAEERRQVRDVLLWWLANPASPDFAKTLVSAVTQLVLTADEEHQAREALLSLLARLVTGQPQHPRNARVRRVNAAGYSPRPSALEIAASRITIPTIATALAGGLVQLHPTPDDQRQARETLLRLLAIRTDHSGVPALVDKLIQLAPSAQDQGEARETLLGLLASKADGHMAAALAGGLVQLHPTSDDLCRARETLLGLLASQTDWRMAAALGGGLVQLAPSVEDKRQARRALLSLLNRQTEDRVAYAESLVRLDPTSDDQRQARETLLRMLASQTGPVIGLAGDLALLDPSAEDRRQAREMLLGMLAGQTRKNRIETLVRKVVELAPSAEDKQQTRPALLRLLNSQTEGDAAAALAEGFVRLDPTGDDQRQARETLLRLLIDETSTFAAEELVSAVLQLAPMADDKRQAREAILGRLRQPTPSPVTTDLVAGVAQLAPTVHDLGPWHAGTLPLTAWLLPAVRQNSALADWLEFLPSLRSLSD